MKKTTLLKSMLLLCALVVGSSSLWAQAPVNTVLWSEDFSGYSNNSDPSGSITNSHTGTTVYGGVTLTYSKANGTTTTQTYSSGGPNSNSNLLISKNNGSFSVSGISTGEATELTVSYAKSGSGTISISTSTTGVTISGSESGSTITTNGATTLQLTFTNTSSSDNLRIDDITVKVKTAGSGSGIAAPTFSVAEGAVAAGTTVELAQEDSYTIRYTTDGTAPTKTTGTVYSDPIVINTPTTIKAIAVNGDDVSSVSSASYTINVAKPTFDVASGTVYVGTLLTITATLGNTIIYTTDGTDPSYSGSNGDIYDSPIEINSAMTVKAIAVDGYDNESGITSAAYTVTYPGAVDITPNYTFFGKAAAFSGSTYAEVSGTQNGITVTYSKGTNDNTYASSTAMRFYAGNTLKIDAPSGKSITTIIFTVTSGTDNMTSSPDTYSTSTHTWTGDATSITFTRSGSSYLQFTKITIVLAAKVSISDAKYATFCDDVARNFSGSGIGVYTAASDGSKVVLSEITDGIVPANTGVVLFSDTKKTDVSIPATAASGSGDYSGNEMVGINVTTKVAADGGSSKTNYILSNEASGVGFYKATDSGANLGAHKAYLSTTNAASARDFLGFEENTTAIESITNSKEVKGEYFNLNGQRVAQPTKGLYIVNGKKVIK